MFKIAVLADSHLPDQENTVKDEVFDWALDQCRQLGVELILAAGDMVSVGTIKAARRVRKKLDACNIPWLFSPGNAELRDQRHRSAVLNELSTPSVFEHQDFIAMVLDNSTGRISDCDMAMLEETIKNGCENLMAAAHIPIDDMPEKQAEYLRELISQGRMKLFIAGHSHYDLVQNFKGGQVHIIRGLDPDKAIGGPPAFVVYEFNEKNKHWSREDYAYESEWTKNDSLEFNDFLGISCMSDSIGGIKDAIEHGVKSLELRFGTTEKDIYPEVSHLIRSWRKAGGRNLSIHFPDIAWDEDLHKPSGGDDVLEACSLAIELEADFITMHVPRCAVGRIESDSDVRARLLSEFADKLQPALDAGIVVGIENLHMNPCENADRLRGYGYTPSECREWIMALRSASGCDNIGFHFDIGHARNNAPYSSLYNLSQWYAEMGDIITGYHLHQVEVDENGQFLNHRTVKNIFGPLISFSSFFRAWKKNQIKHSPMYLEIRGGGGIESLQTFRKYLSEFEN